MIFSLALLFLIVTVIVIVTVLVRLRSLQSLEVGDPVYLYEKDNRFFTQVKLFNSEACQTLPFSTTIDLADGNLFFRAPLKYAESCGPLNVIPHQLEMNSEVYFVFDDASIGVVNTEQPENTIFIPTALDTTDAELAFALNGRLYATKPFDTVVFANAGPTQLFEVDRNNGDLTFLADLELTSNRYPGAICGAPDGNLYIILINIQIIGGLGYSDWPSIFAKIDLENDYAVTEIGEIGGNFGWPGKDMVIFNEWVYVSGYRIPDYFGIIGRFRLQDPSIYEELSDSAFTGFFGASRIFGLAVAGGKLWAGRDDTFFELNPVDGSVVGTVQNLNRPDIEVSGGTSLEAIAAIGVYKVTITKFNTSKFPSTYTTEQALSIINQDSSVNFKYLYMPANTSIVLDRDPITGNFDVMAKDPLVFVQR